MEHLIVLDQVVDLAVPFKDSLLNTAIPFLFLELDSLAELLLDFLVLLLDLLEVVLVRVLQVVEVAFQVQVLLPILFRHLLIVPLELKSLIDLVLE